MKKLLSLMLAFVMMVGIVVPVYADDMNIKSDCPNESSSEIVELNDGGYFIPESLEKKHGKDSLEVTEEMAKEMNSHVIELNDGGYFIPDNRKTALEKSLKETKDYNLENRSEGIIQYGYVVRGHVVPAPRGEKCIVRSTAYVKVIYEQHVYRFLDCQSVNWTAEGTNQYDVKPSQGNYHIEEGGKKLVVSGAFNVETTVSTSVSTSFGACGWSIASSVGGETIIRKFVVKSFKFDVDYENAHLIN